MAANALKPPPSSLFEALVQGLADGVVAFDRELRYTIFNRTMEVMTGMPAAQALGRHAADVFPFLEENGEIHHFERALKGESVAIEARPFFIPSLGKTVYFESHFSPLTDSNGTIVGGCSIVRDVTDAVLEERKQAGALVLEYSENRFRQLVDEMPIIVWSKKPDGQQEFRNRLGEEFFSNGEGQGDWIQAIHPDDRGPYLATVKESLVKGEPYTIETRMRGFSKADYRWMLVRSFPIRGQDGKIIRWIGTASDVHDQKSAFTRLEQLQKVGLALSRAVTLAEVVDIIFDVCQTSVHADRAAVAEILEDQKTLSFMHAWGYPPELTAHATEIYASPEFQELPLARVVRTGKSLYFESLEEMAKASPLAAKIIRNSDEKSLSALPLIVDNRVIGGLIIGFKRTQKFSDETQKFLETLAGLFAQAMERSRLYEREREAREKAEGERSRIFSVLQQIPVAVAVSHGPDHRLVFANPMYMSAVQGKEVLGKPLSEAHPELVEQGIVAATDQVFQTGEAFSSTEQEVRLVAADGQSRVHYFNGNLIPWRNEAGEIEGVLNFSFDVTEHVLQRKRTAISEARLSVAVESARIGLWEWDTASGTAYRNAHSNDAFGFERSKSIITKEEFLEKIHPDDRQRVDTELGIVGRGNSSNELPLEFRVVKPDGSIRWLLDKMWFERDRDGNLIRASGAIVDITHLKETELALMRAKEEAEVANRAKTTFVANMSHEFRTPLCAILGFAEFLGRENLSSMKRASYVDGINRNGEALIKLLEDILDLSRVEAGQVAVEMSEFDPHMLISDVVGLFQSEAIRKGIRLSFHKGTEGIELLASDAVRIRQILINLVGNAVKFTAQGKVEVSLRKAPYDDSQIEFVIADTGVGIKDEARARLFQPFSQGDSSTARKFGGTGLGLVISRRLAEALGGNVELVRSEPGRGSTFSLRVKDFSKVVCKDSDTASSVGTEISRSAPIKGLRALVVEDTSDIRLLLQEYLEIRGVPMDSAVDGREGVEKILDASSPRYDIVLMDLHMPKMDGYTAIQELRSNGYKGKVYALTARALSEDRARCEELGFDGFLVKPIQFDELEKALSVAMRQSSERR